MNEISQPIERKRLVIFGKNGCLCPGIIDPKTGKSRPPSRIEDQTYFDDVESKCAQLIAEGNTLSVISNEGGVAWNILSEDDAKLLTQAAAAYIGTNVWRVSVTHPNGKIRQYAIDSPDRLPNPGMLISIMTELGFTPDNTIMVGDWQFEREAAANVGVKFVWASQFFNRETDAFADRLHAAMDM